MTWAGDAPTARQVAGEVPSLRLTLARCGPVLGLPDEDQPPLYAEAVAEAEARPLAGVGPILSLPDEDHPPTFARVRGSR